MVALAIAVACGCGGSQVTGTADASSTDAEVDSGIDVAAPDAANDVVSVDASTDVETDADPIGSLANVVLWLDATRGVTKNGTTVTTWADQSPNTNNATIPNMGTAPTFVANAFNGMPAIHFDNGASMSIADSTSLRLGTGDFLIEVVVSWTNASNTYGIIFGKAAYTTSPYPGALLLANYPVAPFTVLATQTSINDYVVSGAMGLNDGTPHLVALQRSGNGLIARLDGLSNAFKAFATTDDCSAVGNPAYIGGQGGGIQQLVGNVAEIVEARGTLSPNQVQAIESHLKAKYGL
jgi:hypothetical protein